MPAELASMQVAPITARADLSGALRKANDAVIIVTNDFSGNGPSIAFVNEGSLELTGYGPGELEGSSFTDLLETRPGRDPLACLRANGSGKAIQHATVVLRRVDQSTLRVEFDATPLVDKSGKVIHFAVVLRDTAERQSVTCLLQDMESTRKSLAAAEQRYLAAAEASQDGLVLLRTKRGSDGQVADLEIIDLNRRASELMAMTQEEMLGRGLCELLPQLRDLGYFARCVRVIESGAPYQESIQGQSLGISIGWIRVQVVALGDGVALSVCDISHERALMSQLDKAQRLESVGSLAVGIAHDFNNMLSAILGFGGLALGAQPEGSKAYADIEQVIKAAERATQLTRYLLAFSSRQELEPKAMDASRAIVDLAPILSRLAGPAIELLLELRTTQLVCVDPCRFEQAIVNLVANARDAMPNGGTLTINSEIVTLQRDAVKWTDDISAGQYLCVSVVDTGTGMDETTRSRMFEPFFTTKTAATGTGLGLASVYGFVRQSNGQICVDSEVGQGTVIRLYFPLAHAAMRRSSAPPPRISGTVARHEGRVLLVERDESVRTVARRILTEQGYDVLEASDAWAASNILAQHPVGINVLLTALGLPHRTGIELARTVKLTHPEIGIVLMSGAADMNVIEDAGCSLNAVFIQKPFSAAALLGRIRDAMHLALLGPEEVERCEER